MSESIIQFVERMFVGPLWPASLLVCLLLIYTAFALLGLIDLDFGLGGDTDMDAGLDMDADLGSPDLDIGNPAAAAGEPGVGLAGMDTTIDSDLLGGVGAATLRWTNLQRIPLVLWGSVFTLMFWMVSYGLWYGFDVRRYQPTLWPSLLLVLRNGVIAIGLTKMLTEPLNRFFEPAPRFGPSNLIGRTCVISTSEATESFGQAKFKTDAAPLLLNIRTDGECIPKGSEVRIIAFDAERRIYKVTAAAEEDFA